jgi:Tol biopolymer transport system component
VAKETAYDNEESDGDAAPGESILTTVNQALQENIYGSFATGAKIAQSSRQPSIGMRQPSSCSIGNQNNKYNGEISARLCHDYNNIIIKKSGRNINGPVAC